MGKIKSLNFFTLPEKIKQHNIDVFIKKKLSDLVADSYSWFDSDEKLFKKLIDNYLGKYCFDNNKQMIEITIPLLEQEVRTLGNDPSVSCPISQTSIPVHNRKKKPQSDLFMAATLKNLVRHAVRDRGQGSVDDLFATLIYNYLGKWCHDEHGQLIQVNIALLEAQLRYFLKDPDLRCQVDIDAILSARVNDLITEENACTKAVYFDGRERTTRDNLLFFLRQMNDPENLRHKSQLGVSQKNFPANYNYKYNYPEGKYKPKQTDPSRGQRVKPGTLTTTKTSTSIIPTKPGYMQSFGGGIILLFAFSEVHHAKKYLFRENGNTNSEPHYSSNNYFRPSNAYQYAPLESILKENRAAVKSWFSSRIEWNEVKAGLPKRGVRAIIATDNYPGARLYALESMYITKNTFGLDYDLPVGINRNRNSALYYNHELRVKDAIEARWFHDKKALFQYLVNSSWNKLQDKNLKNELTQLCNQRGFTIPEVENYAVGRHKRYNHSLDVAANRMHITEIRSPAPAPAVSPPGEKILSLAGMLTLFPMVGYGAYKWVKDTFDEDIEVGWDDFGRILGVLLATITLLPVFFTGCYYAVQNLLMPSGREPAVSSVLPSNT